IEQITKDIIGYHTTPVQAAEIAQAAGVKQLVLYHIVPALPLKPMERVFVKGVSDVFKGGVTVSRDGTWIDLPANGSEVNVGNRFYRRSRDRLGPGALALHAQSHRAVPPRRAAVPLPADARPLARELALHDPPREIEARPPAVDVPAHDRRRRAAAR